MGSCDICYALLKIYIELNTVLYSELDSKIWPWFQSEVHKNQSTHAPGVSSAFITSRPQNSLQTSFFLFQNRRHWIKICCTTAYKLDLINILSDPISRAQTWLFFDKLHILTSWNGPQNRAWYWVHYIFYELYRMLEKFKCGQDVK